MVCALTTAQAQRVAQRGRQAFSEHSAHPQMLRGCLRFAPIASNLPLMHMLPSTTSPALFQRLHAAGQTSVVPPAAALACRGRLMTRVAWGSSRHMNGFLSSSVSDYPHGTSHHGARRLAASAVALCMLCVNREYALTGASLHALNACIQEVLESQNAITNSRVNSLQPTAGPCWRVCMQPPFNRTC